MIAPSKIKTDLLQLFNTFHPVNVNFPKREALLFLKESEYNRKDGYLVETECNKIHWNKMDDSQFNDHTAHIECIGNTSLVLSENGIVYMFGENIYKDFSGNRIKGGEDEYFRKPRILTILSNAI